MARKKTRTSVTNVDSIKHKDKRKNIPTEELRDFVAADENAPKKMLYPHDPSFDPQLVWKSKATEAVARTLWVPAVNNHGGFGQWDFLEVDDPWDGMNTIRAKLQTPTGIQFVPPFGPRSQEGES